MWSNQDQRPASPSKIWNLRGPIQKELEPRRRCSSFWRPTWGSGRGRNIPASSSPSPISCQCPLSHWPNPARIQLIWELLESVNHMWYGTELGKVGKSRNGPQSKQAQEWHSRKMQGVPQSLCQWRPKRWGHLADLNRVNWRHRWSIIREYYICELGWSWDEAKKRFLSSYLNEIATKITDDPSERTMPPRESMEPEAEAWCLLKEIRQ